MPDSPLAEKCQRVYQVRGGPSGKLKSSSGLLFQSLLPGAGGNIGCGLEIQGFLLFLLSSGCSLPNPLSVSAPLCNFQSKYFSDAVSGLISTVL